MGPIIKGLSTAGIGIAIALAYTPIRAGEPSHKDSAKAGKAAPKEDHDHSEHEGHGDHKGHDDHAGHGKHATGTGKTDIREISVAFGESLDCLEKEMPAADHTRFHACLETVEALGLDVIALKTPSDPAKKKRVDGYAKNLGMMAHKVDELMDAKQVEKAKAQLKKLKAQVGMIEAQFESPAKKPAVK